MKFPRGFIVAAATILVLQFIVLLGPVQAQVVRGNGIYSVEVADNVWGANYGQWTAYTGILHPAGSDQDLLFPLGTSFGALSSYTSGLYYAQEFVGWGTHMDGYLVAEGESGYGPGWSTSWIIPEEGLLIVQDVFVAGATYDDSAIYATVYLENTGDLPVTVGWRNYQDWAINGLNDWDDGPNNSIETYDAVIVPPTTIEFDYVPAGDEFVRLSPDPDDPAYQPLFTIGYDPGFVPELPSTTPDQYTYADWSQGGYSGWDYTIGPLDVTYDSSGVSWFGKDADSAILLGPGESTRVTQILFGVLPDEPPPGRVEVSIDIKFCSDPNAFNCKKNGVLPVTIFGTDTFFVMDVDLSTLQLCTPDLLFCTGAPYDYSYADRGDPTLDLGAAQCDIDPESLLELDWTENQDDFLDLDAAFLASEVKALLGDFCIDGAKGDVSGALVIIGETYDGLPIYSVPQDDNTGIDRLVKANR